MKIAMICTEKLPVPPVLGGAVQIYIEGILPYLRKQHEITVYTVKSEGLADEEIVDGVRYVRVDALPKQSYIGNVIERLESSLELVHVFNRPTWVKLIAEKLPEVKISLSLHNDMFRPKKISSEEAISCINRVEFISTVSRYVAKGVEKLYPEAGKKLRVVYSGANIESYKPRWSQEAVMIRKQLAQKYGLLSSKVVLFVGRINEKKGVDILLKAMHLVMKVDPHVALLVIGSSWFGTNEETEYIQELRRLAEMIRGKIIFTGFLTPDEVRKHYCLADVFVCPSQWNEPLARVHYEAMAAGVPIVTTDRGGNAEVIRGYANGIVIRDYSNPTAFAREILYLLRNRKRAMRIGRNGRRTAENRFSFKQTASRLAIELEQVERRFWSDDKAAAW